MPEDVSVIVPVWNGRSFVERLMASLSAQTRPVGETLIVDNGSDDGAPEAAERMGARVIRMGSNTGFSCAVNRGIQEAKHPWLAIINSDIELAPEWLERLLEAANEPDTWFVTGKILSMARRGEIDGAWDEVCRGGCAWRVGNGRRDGPEFSQARAIHFAPATAALFRADLFRRVGMFDEGFESYLEDVDFGLRCARVKLAGRYTPGAVAYHAGSAALGRWNPAVVRRIARNQVFLVAKYYPAGILCRFAWPILLSHTLWGTMALRHGAFLAFLRGKLEGLVRWRSVRRAAARIDPELLAGILCQSEAEIHRVQRLAGFDWYWRVYFTLAPGGSD